MAFIWLNDKSQNNSEQIRQESDTLNSEAKTPLDSHSDGQVFAAQVSLSNSVSCSGV